MPRYIEECDVYKLVEPTGLASVHCSDIDALQRADVAPKNEVERLERMLNSYALQYGTVVDQQKVIEKAKSEVAREVISEFKAMLKFRMMRLGIYPVALHRSLEHIEKKLTEKYTEGNNEKKTE